MTIILTNGCFEFLHAGHMALLQAAKRLGGRLIVGLNSDESVKRLKGEGRPLQPARQREFALRCVRYVDDVIVFEEDRVDRLIIELKPQFWVKGGDYTMDTLDKSEVAAAQQVGAQIVIVPEVFDVHISKMIRKL